MNILLGLCLGIGALLVWNSCWSSPEKTVKAPKTSKVEVMLRQVGADKISPQLFYTISASLGILLGLLVLAMSGIYGLALLGALLGAFAPYLVIHRRATQRLDSMRELWPDVVDHLRSAVRAGMSLPEALMQLQYRGPEELRPVFEQFARDYRSSGDFLSSLNRLKDRLSDPTSDNIVEALKVTREVGGTDLGRLLGTLSEFLRENARTRAEIQARQSWTVNAAKLAVVAPWAVLLLMGTQPSTVQIYNSFAGMMVLLFGIAVSVFAYRLMLRIGKLPQEKRVLA